MSRRVEGHTLDGRHKPLDSAVVVRPGDAGREA